MPHQQLWLFPLGDYCSTVNRRPRRAVERLRRELCDLSPSVPVAEDAYDALVSAARGNRVKLGRLKGRGRIAAGLSRLDILPIETDAAHHGMRPCRACGHFFPGHYIGTSCVCYDCAGEALLDDEADPARLALGEDWGSSVVGFRRAG